MESTPCTVTLYTNPPEEPTMERSEHTANLGMEAAIPHLRRYPAPVPTRKLSWLSTLLIRICGF